MTRPGVTTGNTLWQQWADEELVRRCKDLEDENGALRRLCASMYVTLISLAEPSQEELCRAWAAAERILAPTLVDNLLLLLPPCEE